MARNDSKQNGQTAPRVYKASAVHKRRAGRTKPAVDPVRSDVFDRALEELEHGSGDPEQAPNSSSPHQSERSAEPASSCRPNHDGGSPLSGHFERSGESVSSRRPDQDGEPPLSHHSERIEGSPSPCHSERSEESPRSGLPDTPLRGDPSPSAQDDNRGAAQDDNRGAAQDGEGGVARSDASGVARYGEGGVARHDNRGAAQNDNAEAAQDDNRWAARDGNVEVTRDDGVDRKGASFLVHSKEKSNSVTGDDSEDEFPDDVADPVDNEPFDAPKVHQRKKVRLRTVVLALLAVIVVVAVAAVSLFAWNRWGRYNDAEDFKGTWYVQGTAVPITIDDSLIHLVDDVAYSYALDERDKTIGYSFGDWKGQGRYWFSDDRSLLVITDGSDFTGASNTADDFAKMLDGLKPGGSSSEAEQAEGDGSIALSRTAPTVAFVAWQVNDRIAQEKAAAQEALDEEAYDYYY